MLWNVVPICIQNASYLCSIPLFKRTENSYVIPDTIDAVLELINFLIPKIQSAMLYNSLIKGS